MTLRPIIDLPDEGIILSDGTRLSARIWRPRDADADPVPAILEFLPYRKRDGTVARDALTHPWFARRGYAGVRVDMRGNGDSEGVMEDEYTPQELSDAVEVIHWLAAQPWCSGAVGMMGISWGGFNGLQVAALAPEPLKAVITLCSTVDRYADDIHYKGGCLLNENLGWGATMWSYSSRPPDPALVGDKWRDMWLERLEAEPFLPAVWLEHQTRDAYWQHGSVCEDYSAIKAAVLAVGGWNDAYKNAVPALVENLRAPVKGIIGPWVHKYPHFAVPGPRIGFLQEAVRWWDKWLKGIETGVEDDPDLRLYVMDGVRPATRYDNRTGRWVGLDKGEFAGLGRQCLHLGPDRDLGDTPQEIRALVASPQHTGASAGEYCAIWLGPELPGDQRQDDALSAAFDTRPLAADLDIVGAPRVRLRLASDQPQGQIAVRLNHVHPDGASTRITYGVLNLSHREGHAAPVPLPVGAPVEVTLDLDHIAYRLPAGHRLRLAISSAYWPLIWPAPAPTNLTLLQGTVDLPLLGDAGRAVVFAPPETDAPWQSRVLRPPANSRVQSTDLGSGTVNLEIIDDFGEFEDMDHGLITGSVAREWWEIHPDDPLSARGRTHWTETIRRGKWSVRTETTSQMWSDSSHFYIEAWLEAWEGEDMIHEKSIKATLPRSEI